MSIETFHSAACEGDVKAEEELFARLAARYRLFAQQKIRDREDAEEVAQDALTTVYEKYKEVRIQTSFVAWAHRVLSNKILDYYKAKGRRQKRIVSMATTPEPSRAETPDPAFELRLLDCLRELNAVNRRHARVLNLSYQGFRVEEICARLNVSRTNLYSMLSRARTLLADCLEKGGIKL